MSFVIIDQSFARSRHTVGLRTKFLLTAFLLAGGASAAQEQTNQAANPLDPAALNAPPAFGDSGPVQRTPIAKENRDSEASLENRNTLWKPKFVVLLTTQPAEFEVVPDPSESGGEAAPANSAESADESPQQIVLLCDDVNVQAGVEDGGTAAWRFSCRQGVTLKIQRTTITGDSVTWDGTTIMIRNAVVSLNNHVTLKSETMKMSVRVTAVQIQPAATERPPAEESLKPIPDSIGSGRNGEPSPREEGSQKDAGSQKLEPH